MIDTDASLLPPLSAQGYGLATFMSLLRYPPGPGRRHRFEGDFELLGLLDEELRLSRAFRRATVGDLPEAALRRAVELTETLRYGTWTLLSGSADQPILERLDAHFLPLQERYVEERQAQEELRERQARGQEERDAAFAAELVERERRLWGLPAA